MSTEGAKAFAAVVLGVLAVLALPAAVAATKLSEDFTLLQAGFAVPAALILGVGAIALARAVRARSRASIEGGSRLKAATVGRLLGIVGVCIGCSGAIALGFYALLVHLE
jgi:nitrogen fixation/metabolism regulation signal transduction histidine kinase